MSLISGWMERTKILNIERKNFIILFDVSSLLSSFVIPYAQNLDTHSPNDKNAFSPKHAKLEKFPIKILVTPTIIGMSATKLSEKFIHSNGVAQTVVERLCKHNSFILKSSIDDDIDSTMIDDFEKSDGSREDCIHICTANYYKTPIITDEVKRLDMWKKHCKHPVINNKDFLEFS